MKESSETKNRNKLTKDSIIGLGELSFRKNYYSELQEKLMDLERINTRNRALISTIPDFLLVSSPEGEISLLCEADKRRSPIIYPMTRAETIMAPCRNAV